MPQLRSIAAESRLMLSSLLWWRGRGTSPDNIPLTYGSIDGLYSALENALRVDTLSPDTINKLGEAVGLLCDAASAVPVRYRPSTASLTVCLLPASPLLRLSLTLSSWLFSLSLLVHVSS